jgi:hypothetical protein
VSTAADLRRLALALPGAYEDLHRGKATFRVAKRIFAMLGEPGGQGFMGLDRPGVAILKLEPEDQLNMVAAHPEALARLSDYGHHGWTVAQLAALDEPALSLVVRLAWIRVAPKRLVTAS